MWTGGMTFEDSIIISLVGLLVVFSALAVPAPAIDEESYAVLLAAVSEEARLSGEQFRVTSIKEL